MSIQAFPLVMPTPRKHQPQIVFYNHLANFKFVLQIIHYPDLEIH